MWERQIDKDTNNKNKQSDVKILQEVNHTYDKIENVYSQSLNTLTKENPKHKN